MDRRLLIVVVATAAAGFLVLTLLRGDDKKDASSPDTPAASAAPAVPAPAQPVAPVTGAATRDERLFFTFEEPVAWPCEAENGQCRIGEGGYSAVFSNFGATLKSFRLLKPQYAQKDNANRPNPLPSTLKGFIPDYAFAPGPLELISTWKPGLYPFRFTFSVLEHASEVQRRLRPPSSAGQLSADGTSLHADREISAFLGAYPAVAVGDEVRIEQPADRAGTYVINRVVDDGTLSLTAAPAAAAPVPAPPSAPASEPPVAPAADAAAVAPAADAAAVTPAADAAAVTPAADVAPAGPAAPAVPGAAELPAPAVAAPAVAPLSAPAPAAAPASSAAVTFSVWRRGPLQRVFLGEAPIECSARRARGEPCVEPDQRFTLVRKSAEELVYVWPDPAHDQSQVFFEKRIRHQPQRYAFDVEFRVHNLGPSDLRQKLEVDVNGWQPPVETASGCMAFASPPPDVLHPICLAGDTVQLPAGGQMSGCGCGGKPNDDIFAQERAFGGGVAFAGVETRYFLLAALPRSGGDTQCRLGGFRAAVPNAGGGETPIGAVYRAHVTSAGQSQVVVGVDGACAPEWFPEGRGLPNCAGLYARLGVPPGAPPEALWNGYVERKRRLFDGLTGAPDIPAEAKAGRIRELCDRALGDRPQGDRERLADRCVELEALRRSYDALRARGDGENAARYTFFVGPKEKSALDEVDPSLERALDFWIVGVLAKPMLAIMRFFHALIPHWGVAILLLTILVKLALLPLTQRSMRQMKRMQQLKPQLDELKVKYGSDKQRFNQEMWALYKREKVNPLGGCLPMLIQMPFWIALYRAIYSSVELYQAPLFFWIDDLSAPDPYYVLPLLLGVMMALQQWLTPSTADSKQARMMMLLMPLMFTFVMLGLPTGLVWYILINTLLSVAQQWYINRNAGPPRARAATA